MGRNPTKAAGNPWYEARIAAAKYDNRLYSRDGAGEQLGMSASSISDAENDVSKCMPVDKAVLMADLYNAPQLLNYYCTHECPIGRHRPLSCDVVGIEKVTVKLLKELKVSELESLKEKLLEIASDGVISDDEKPEMKEIIEYFDKLSKTLSELKILGQIALNDER